MTATPAKKRPLSPHLGIYKPQISSIMSILHRMTGVALAFGLLILVAWLVFLAGGPQSYGFFTDALRPALGQLALMIIFFAVFFYLLTLVNCCVIWRKLAPSKPVKCLVLFLDFAAAVALAVLARNFFSDNYSPIFQTTCIWLGTAVLFGLTASFFYHFCCGIRHLLWDAGWFLSLKGMHITGWITLLIAAVCTIGLWVKILGIVTW